MYRALIHKNVVITNVAELYTSLYEPGFLSINYLSIVEICDGSFYHI